MNTSRTILLPMLAGAVRTTPRAGRKPVAPLRQKVDLQFVHEVGPARGADGLYDRRGQLRPAAELPGSRFRAWA